jgi:hypothetical protein
LVAERIDLALKALSVANVLKLGTHQNPEVNAGVDVDWVC